MHHHPMRLLLKRKNFLFLMGALFMVISLLVTIVLPLEYRADADVLIISKTRYGVDPYTVIKSAERVGENLAQITATDDFYAKVIDQPGYSLDTLELDALSAREKRKAWGKMVQSSVVFGTGVLRVSAYNTDKNQAIAFAGATVDALVSKGWEYVGGDVTMKIVNRPVVTKWPVRPNIVVNGLFGLFAGLLFGAVLVLQKQKRHFG
ncbi:hypothetical protein KKG22_02065 [Patescibacteria group bacterium]|nr:hypothetical protein [Patescibacteria group bacterium]MBU1721862.1 hypothetical protein [Patescibacteria group bacterium]MBU1901320.1 hypothetical protein [Patescibacteria group bacterium]